MCKRILKIRRLMFGRQHGLCFYCRQPMWEDQREDFMQAHGLSAAQADFLRSTAEHVVARQDGGHDTPANIVAACKYCNWHRHVGREALPSTKFASKVRQRLGRGRWHGIVIHPLH